MNATKVTSSWCIALACVATLAARPASAAAAAAADSAAAKPAPVTQWLVLGPFDAPLPAYHDQGKKKVGAKEILAYPHLAVRTDDDRAPRDGMAVARIGGGSLRWRTASADTAGIVLSAPTGAASAGVAYLAAYVDVPRWMKVQVAVRSTQPFALEIDGASVAKRDTPAKPDAKPVDGSAKLKQGKHRILVKTVCVPGDSAAAWRVGVTVAPAKGFDTAPVLSTDPKRVMTIDDVLEGPSMRGAVVSPDGELVAVSLTLRETPEGDRDGWEEVHRTKDGSLVRSLRDVGGSSWAWAPTGHRLSYVTREKGKGTVRVMDLDRGSVDTIVEGIDDFQSYRWSPDGTFIVYSVEQKAEEEKHGVKRMRGLNDKRAGERNRSYLYLASVPEGVTRRLTAGKWSTRLQDISPDAKTVLFERTWEDLSARPYSTTELVRLTIADGNMEVLATNGWLGGAEWSPDGKRIVVTGGPSTFGDIGKNVPKGVIPNDYDVQAYILDPATKAAEAITKTFAPSVVDVHWAKDGDLYFVVEDGEYVTLYRYNVGKKRFSKIEVPCEVIQSSDVARDAPVMAITGSSAAEAWRLYAVNLHNGKSRLVLYPTKKRFADVRFGKVEPWDFTSKAGAKIVGRIYYPPGFDPAKKYPCIVYYYGGTVPVDRTFGGRYPKNLWAAHGYVIYVPQPSGATGFGQAFSTKHVNDWGKTTAEEIIEGTQKFLAAHPFVDPKRVGCIGASFGGFMTELLVTKTDIFAAAVSHAGISDISSYWGVGYWGYEYNAVSAANSFPWNRRDIYVDQSPLYGADKVTTPILLLHGGADTNVPRGESDQFYVALKLLGKEVEYIRIAGQNHWILDFKKRIVWNDAIISWFDRWLKNEPQWWNDMYPPLDKDSAGDEDKGSSARGGAGGSEPVPVATGARGGLPGATDVLPGAENADQASIAGADVQNDAPAAKYDDSAAKGAPAGAPGDTTKTQAPDPGPMAMHRVEIKDYNTVLLGDVTREEIEKNIPNWGADEDGYVPDSATVAELAPKLADCDITVIFGTWCSDSQRQVPRLWKVLAAADYPIEDVPMLAVMSSKFTPDMPIPPKVYQWAKAVRAHYGITAVETIIVSRGGKELGRIVESPKDSIERDLLAIVSR